MFLRHTIDACGASLWYRRCRPCRHPIDGACQPVEGAATRLTARLLKWTPSDSTTYPIGGTYTISGVHLTDLNANAATAGATFTHLDTSDQMLLLAYQAPTDTQPEAQSAYGVTTLFQGRTWHGDLGMYYYRARWYLPELGEFAERDPFGYAGSPTQYFFVGADPANSIDPTGLFQDYVLTKEYKVQGGQATQRDAQDVPEVNIDYLAPWLSKAAQKALSGLFKKDVGPDAGRQVLEDLLRKLTDWAAWASKGDPATDYLAEIALSLAEKYDGTGGVSMEGAAALAGFGGHFGLNMQAFPPQQGSTSTDYRLGFYGFETLKNLSEKEMMNKIKQGHDAEGVFAPGGVFGVLASAGVGLNAAKALQKNGPSEWAGFFQNVSANWPASPPMPSGASLFWSQHHGKRAYAGAEGSWGTGIGLAWSRPYYHLWAALRMDRPTAKALLSATLARAIH